ncbi:MAG: hypothetical protein M1290_01130 [Candidatus Thermoplasmatota archaeon]|nr:hypothetical protein [Candidatus Thermoplasmatota archaeon]
MFEQREGICPVCGKGAKYTRKWVMNKYKKRYDYLIYWHQGYTHYSNQRISKSNRFRKGELEKILIETINSQDFKLGSFRIMEIKNLLAGSDIDVGFGSLKSSLNRLAEMGIVEKQKKGRGLLYVNTVSKERLSFVINSIAIWLEDIDRDSSYRRHMYSYRVKNDHSWPLYFIPFRAVGDVDMSFENINFVAFDSNDKKPIRVILVEDAPKDKRLLLKLSNPMLPNDIREINFQYDWQEPRLTYVFSAATKIDSFTFSVSGRDLTKLSISLTSGNSNETRDLSSEVEEYQSSDLVSVKRIQIINVEPFAVIQLRWK